MTDHDAQRLALARRSTLGGLVAAVLGSASVGLLGGSGRAGLAAFFALAAAGCVIGGLLTAVLAVVDEYRRAHVSRRRIGTVLSLFVAGGVLLVMAAGVVGGG